MKLIHPIPKLHFGIYINHFLMILLHLNLSHPKAFDSVIVNIPGSDSNVLNRIYTNKMLQCRKYGALGLKDNMDK